MASLESTPLLAAAVPAGGVLGGVAAFEPDGRADSPFDDGSGRVSGESCAAGDQHGSDNQTLGSEHLRLLICFERKRPPVLCSPDFRGLFAAKLNLVQQAAFEICPGAPSYQVTPPSASLTDTH